jgi:acyl-CoA thioesterase-1
MSRAVQATGAKPLLLGMQMPPNYGQDYAQQFAATFTTVARKTGAGLVPFLLKGVADAPDAQRLFQSDGIHPAQEAHPMMLNNVWDVLKKLIA